MSIIDFEIKYLLALQNMRETWGDFLAPFMDWITKLAISFFPILLICLVYWVYDREFGRVILGGYAGGRLIGGFLKLTCCINRPWILDSRVIPYGDSMVAATGYSFPSGHSIMATSAYGGVGIWFKNKSKCIMAIFFAMIALTMFSRNYMGVHTPKDVLVGCLISSIMLAVSYWIEKWTNKDLKRDKIILIVGIIICIAFVIYYFTKTYPLDYLPDGSLLVDPDKMRADSFEGIGAASGFVICRFFERHYLDFDDKMKSRKDRFIISVIALVPLFFWYTYSVEFFQDMIGRNASKFIRDFIMMIYIMNVVPLIMSKLSKLPETLAFAKKKKVSD